ncbi:BslIM [Erysipelothrix rhusiopathiae SY1027]|uniref:hypothetical protein n=1 Tax=Erysipelothrix rhusiopathiae TaxID=1648 RepID=UPI0003348D77|nr:hypothetical protein [Erysipelothrix rhusiopathiae]AGN24553.1 BslIM [Erysipelothrix rhusiopathiae SY1027]
MEVRGSDQFTSDNIASIIEKNYDKLSNYHNMIIRFIDDESIVKWKTISEVALFMEQFKQESNFNAYNKRNKKHRIADIKNFLKNHNSIKYNDTLDEQIEDYFTNVSYGFYFEDLFISDNGKEKVLIMQKVELDETDKKMP